MGVSSAQKAPKSLFLHISLRKNCSTTKINFIVVWYFLDIFSSKFLSKIEIFWVFRRFCEFQFFYFATYGFNLLSNEAENLKFIRFLFFDPLTKLYDRLFWEQLLKIDKLIEVFHFFVRQTLIFAAEGKIVVEIPFGRFLKIEFWLVFWKSLSIWCSLFWHLRHQLSSILYSFDKSCFQKLKLLAVVSRFSICFVLR